MYQISTRICSETFSNFDATIQAFVLLAKADSIVFSSYNHFLTHSCLMFTEFSSACNWKQASQYPVLPRSAEHIFCDPSFSFQFSFLRYLRQWIIEIFIITQPYKLCTKRETKVQIAIPRKIT